MQCSTTANGSPVGKKQYESKAAALQALARTAKKLGWDKSLYSVYKCGECKRWHFGKDIFRKPARSARAPAITQVSFP